MKPEWTDADRFVEYAGGLRAPPGSLEDPTLQATLRTYKRQVAKRYRVLAPALIEQALGSGPYFISTKLDGELWFLVKRGDDVFLCGENGRILKGIPMLAEAEKRLEDHGDLVVAGELTSARADGKRARVHHVATALGAADLEPTLHFSAFDLVDDPTRALGATDYGPRLEALRSLFGDTGRVGVVTTVLGNAVEVKRRFAEWVASEKHEGLVVRSERGLTYKIKSSLTLDAVVLAYGERISGGIHHMRELSLGLLRDDGTFQLLGALGTGFADEDRVAWHARLSAMEVPSTFRLANREGTLSRFVKPRIVLEVRCSDVIVTDSWDSPIRRMSLRYDAEGGYTPAGETHTAVMIHPVFLRERADKMVDIGHVGMTQITRHVPLASGEEKASTPADRPSQILVRKVFVKESKSGLAVRKAVILETHKAAVGWPPFVLFASDYSAGRREPLQTQLRTAPTLERAKLELERWLLANVKRGWVERTRSE